MKDNKISNAYLRAFFQYLLLYNKLSNLYPDDMNEYFNLNLFYENDIYSTICDFIIFILFDKFSLIENQLNKLKEIKKSKKAFELFYEKKSCDLKSPTKFLQYLEDNDLFKRISQIMKLEKNLFLYNGKNVNKRIKHIICTSFKKFIYYSDTNTRENLEKLIVENINFYNYIEFEKFFDCELNNEYKKKLKGIFDKLFILLYIKKKINENNFINELENNFGVYLDIDETIKKLNEIITNSDIFSDKEIGNLDTIIYKRIKNLIEELLILDDNKSIKTTKKEIYFDNWRNRFDNYYDFFGLIYDSTFNFDYIKIRCKIGPHLFGKFISMKIDNLKLLYLYCYERLKKSINRKNNNLSLIESMFIKISLNDNIDENCEWYNFICEKQEYDNDKENKNNYFNYNEFVSKNKDFISYFHDLIRLNEKLLLENFEIGRFYFNSLPIISKYIVDFAEKYLDKNVYKRSIGLDFLLNFDKNDETIKKLKEIYNSGDMTLLTFYELVLLEYKSKLDYGFLSSLETQYLYDFQMKESIKKLTEKQRSKINRIDKKQKIINKKLDNKLSKFKINKRNTFTVMKLNLWKTQALLKVKKIKDYKQNNNYKYY